jgi:hypothetical protein
LTDARADPKEAPKGSTQFGGGFGYLLRGGASNPVNDPGEALLTTYYTGVTVDATANDTVDALTGAADRKFGVGYAQTSTQSGGWNIQHTSAVPVGDDPVVVIEVAITNTASEAADVRWVEVFSSLMVQMDPNNFRLPGVDRRHFSTTHYASLFSPSAAGLSHARRWLGLTANESEFVQREINYTLPAGASVYDVAPPTSFASVLNPLAAQIAVGNDGHAFFGGGGPSAPSCGIQMNSSTEAHASLIISTPLTVEAGDVKKVYLIYGYTVPTDAPGKKEELIAKYEKLVSGNADLATLVAAEWLKKLTKLSIPSVPWLGAEVLWNSYYLQGGVTYDSFFQEHILNQGMTYQYVTP